MSKCVVYGCKNRNVKPENREEIRKSFHRFPNDQELKEKWIAAIGRHNWEPTEYSRICCEHFEEDAFDNSSPFRKYLNKGAVPTIFKALTGPLKSSLLIPKDFKRARITKRSLPLNVSDQSETPSRIPTSKAICKTLTCTDQNVKKMKREVLIEATTDIKKTAYRSAKTSKKCKGIATVWVSKIKKLDEVQRVLAENLITQVFTKAYFLKLTKNTQIEDLHAIKKEMDFNQ